MDLKTACEIFGVSEDCTMEELEKHYYALTERRLSRDELERVHDAYNVLREHIEATAPKPDIPFGQKVSNFFYHYKLHLLIGSVFAIILGLFAYSMIEARIEKAREAKLPPPAIEVMLFGEYYENTDLEVLEERIYDMFPDWERIKLELTYAPSEARSEFDIAALQKSMAILAVERPDVYIFDLEQFNKFRDQAMFVPLDIFESKPETEDRWMVFQGEEDDEEHIYAIDLTGHELFADTEIAHQEQIVAIRADAENKENAIEFLLEALK